MENSIVGRRWSTAKLVFIVQKCTQNANGDVPLKVKKNVINLVSLSSMCAHVHSLQKMFLFHGDNVNQLR